MSTFTDYGSEHKQAPGRVPGLCMYCGQVGPRNALPHGLCRKRITRSMYALHKLFEELRRKEDE